MVLGKAEVWCDECASTQMAKVLAMTPGYTKITAAECLVCGARIEPRASDQGKDTDHDVDHAPEKIDGA